MMKKIDHRKMGRSCLGWLDSWFHFSFAEYYNPKNMHYGVLRVVNDDTIQPHTGFETHPHRDMEIITYVIEGELTHADSMQNVSTLKRKYYVCFKSGFCLIEAVILRSMVKHAFHGRIAKTVCCIS